MRDWMEDHPILSKVIIGIIVFFVICLIIRTVNMNRKKNEPNSTEVTSEESVKPDDATSEESGSGGLEQDEEELDTENEYQASLGLNKPKGDGKVDVVDKTPEPTKTPEPEKPKEAKYPVVVNVFDKTNVPKINVDGSSCKAYLNSVSLEDFDAFWGSDLTDNDFKGNKRYLVGVKQNPDDAEKGSLQSVGWLIKQFNAKKFKSNDCIKFTNLHVIGSLSDTHVAVLCSYDWYSAFGLKDTLVVFEDMSNTLKRSDFKGGNIFSAIVYCHNIKVKSVNGFNVVCCEYATFE